MDPYEDSNPSNPQTSFRRLSVHSVVLPWVIGAIVAAIAVVGVVALFWSASHPKEVSANEQPVGTSGVYSSEGGHDPLRRLGSTRAELKFRGDTTAPVATPQSAEPRR